MYKNYTQQLIAKYRHQKRLDYIQRQLEYSKKVGQLIMVLVCGLLFMFTLWAFMWITIN